MRTSNVHLEVSNFRIFYFVMISFMSKVCISQFSSYKNEFNLFYFSQFFSSTALFNFIADIIYICSMLNFFLKLHLSFSYTHHANKKCVLQNLIPK